MRLSLLAMLMAIVVAALAVVPATSTKHLVTFQYDVSVANEPLRHLARI